MPKGSPGTATRSKSGTAWRENAKRTLVLAARRRKLSRLPVQPTRRRLIGMFGFVNELAPADRALIDEWIRAHRIPAASP